MQHNPKLTPSYVSGEYHLSWRSINRSLPNTKGQPLHRLALFFLQKVANGVEYEELRLQQASASGPDSETPR